MTVPEIGDTVYDAKKPWRRGVVWDQQKINGTEAIRIETRRGEHLTILLSDVVLVRRKTKRKD